MAFRRRKDNGGPTPSRSLNLQYAVVPENGEKFSDQFRGSVKSNENIDLDYGISSLNFVDEFLQRFKDQGLTVNDFAETIFVAGCYAGQVMVCNNSGIWVESEKANLPEEVIMSQLVIKLPDGTICDPIAKAFKRFYNGEEDSIHWFYKVMTSQR